MYSKGASVTTHLGAGLLRIVLERPDAGNALDDSTVEALRQAFEKAGRDRDVHIVLLTGRGPSFCVGSPLPWVRDLGSDDGDENQRSAQRLASLFLEMDSLEKPIVGRVQGRALGDGAGLVAACDLAVAATTAHFALSDVRMGLVPAVSAPYILRKIGPARTRELILTGRDFDGAAAASLGLVVRAVDPSLLDAAVERVLKDLKECAPEALARSKAALREIELQVRSREDQARWSAGLLASARAGEEARSRIGAFLDGTRPTWEPVE